jgi:ADP-ribose diphosphatase
MRDKPQILRSSIIAKTRIFRVEELELKFSNGRVVTFERVKGSPRGAVLIVPLKNRDTLLLVREYCAGVDRYELAFPKGLVDPGETVVEAANRELKEEVGCGAHRLSQLTSMSIAPGYYSHQTHVVIAEELYEEKLKGDEPEEIQVVEWPLENMHELIHRDDFTEARSIAALYMTKEFIEHRGRSDD